MPSRRRFGSCQEVQAVQWCVSVPKWLLPTTVDTVNHRRCLFESSHDHRNPLHGGDAPHGRWNNELVSSSTPCHGRAWPGHDTTGHDTTGHDTTGHDTTGHDTTGHDTTGHDTMPTTVPHAQYFNAHGRRSGCHCRSRGAGPVAPKQSAARAYACLGIASRRRQRHRRAVPLEHRFNGPHP
jgi:hypothetical protein